MDAERVFALNRQTAARTDDKVAKRGLAMASLRGPAVSFVFFFSAASA
jgi:hypothetical protein